MHGPAQRRIREGLAGKMGQGLLPMELLGSELLQPGRVNKEMMGGDVFDLAGPGFSRLDHQELPFGDRKSTRLNSSHQIISYAVFCLKKKRESHRVVIAVR